jgi:ESF2/ABP1 family protein
MKNDTKVEAAGSSVLSDSSISEQEANDEISGDEDEYEQGFVEGMDRNGFIGDKSLKPLTPQALAAFRVAQDRAGVIYISRIPPGMQPAKVRHLMSAFGEVGRVYLQQEGMQLRRPCKCTKCRLPRR